MAELHQAAALYETQLVTNVSVNESYRRWRVAAALTGRLADTGAALQAGQLSLWGATVIAQALDPLSDDHAAQVQHRVMAKVVAAVTRDDDTTGVTVTQLRRWLRAAIATVDPSAAARRHQTGVRERGVQRWALPDGLARLVVTSAAHDVDVMHQALTVLAGPDDAEDPRSLGARRVDALLGLCLAGVTPSLGDTGRLPSRPATPVTAQIVIDLATLCGLADNAGELRGYGTIPATIARGWLANATTWRRLVTDPVSGHLLDAGPVVRFAPDQLRAFVIARDQTCTSPGCRQPAARADLDHHPPWQPDATGGSTSAETMAALCRRHHRLRTHAHWTITQRQHGTTTWASPSGRVYTTTPPPVLPD